MQTSPQEMLFHLIRRAFWAMTLAGALVFALAVAAAVVRLLPWIASPTVPWAASREFAKLLLMASAEVALIVAPPIGAAVETARWNGEGTALALRTLGVGPMRLAVSVGAAAALFGLMALGVSARWGSEAGAPGHFSNELIQQAGEKACGSNLPAAVPMVDLTWLCVADEPRLVGIVGSGRAAWTARRVRFEPDLSSVHLTDVRATLRSPPAHLHVDEVVVSGFIPWLVPVRLRGIVRGAAYALTALVASSFAALGILMIRDASRAKAMLVGASGPILFLSLGGRLIGAQPLIGLFATILGTALLPLFVALFLSRPWLLATLRSGTKSAAR